MTSKIGQFLFWMSGLLVFAVSPVASTLAKGIPPYIVVTELPEWMPGKPERSTQYVFWDGGKGQLSEIAQGAAVRVSDFTYGPQGIPSLIVKEIFSMDANYGAAKVPGRVVEGRGNRVIVVAHALGQTKFVTADRALLPLPVVDLVQRVNSIAQSKSGSFVSLRVLPESYAADLKKTGNVPILSLTVVGKFPEIQEVVDTPFKLVPFPDIQWEQLREALKLKSPPFNIELADGTFARLEFFQ
jgi:hypothetical protein